MRVLILGGTCEAAALAAACARRPHLDVVSSLAGRTRDPRTLPGKLRTGGFGGADGLARYLRDAAIAAVIDATHPFAARMSANAEAACRAAGVPRVRLLRPVWPRRPGDLWHEVDDLEQAAARARQLGRRIFITAGRTDLSAFAEQSDVWFLVRTVDPVERPPLRNALWITGRGPFRVADERALLQAHGIDVVITKASGGDATYAKLAAAHELGVPVVMVKRPPPPPGPVVETVEAALAWLEQGAAPQDRSDEARGRST